MVKPKTKTKYGEIFATLTPAQREILSLGGTAKLGVENFTTDDPQDLLYLTPTQIKQIGKFMEKYAVVTLHNMHLKLSKAQREYHVKHGKGLFGDILRTVQNGAVSGVQWVGDKGLGAVGNLAAGSTGRLTGLLPSAYGISSGADSLLKKGVSAGTGYAQDRLRGALDGLKRGKGVIHGGPNRTAIHRPLEGIRRRPQSVRLETITGQGLYLPGQGRG
jgi:hypothetical protein